jgi:hypothetical protein
MRAPQNVETLWGRGVAGIIFMNRKCQVQMMTYDSVKSSFQRMAFKGAKGFESEFLNDE